MSSRNPYEPEPARVIAKKNEADGVVTLRLKFKNSRGAGGSRASGLSFEPGQFVELTVFGVGEAPFSISSSPIEKGFFEVTVKNFGNVSRAAQELGPGDVVGVRGPFGKPFPVKEFFGKNIALVAGGVGMAPLRSTLKFVLANRSQFKEIQVFYGARVPKEFCFFNELKALKKSGKAQVFLSINEPAAGWREGVGYVNKLVEERIVGSRGSVVLLCGPPKMMESCAQALLAKGFGEKQLFLSLERTMKCGFGKCGRCAVLGKFICLDGPVFDYSEAKKLVSSE